MPPNQRPPQRPPAAGAPLSFPRPPIVERGPRAVEIQPPQRRDPALLYTENVIALFDEPQGSGSDKVKRGVALEIARVVGDILQTDGGSVQRIFINFLDPRTGQPLAFENQNAKDPRRRRGAVWYACNQTAKDVLTVAFGTDRIVNWIGWVGIRWEMVPNNLKGRGVMVPGLRLSSRLPLHLRPTFDYAAALAKRVERLGEPQQSEYVPPTDDELFDAEQSPPDEKEASRPMVGASEMSDEERRAIEEDERGRYTADPEATNGQD